MTTQRFYATFGVQYREVKHPTLPPEFCNPDGVMEVVAPDMERARAMVSAATDNAYAFLYPWPEPGSPEVAKMEHYYPLGVICTLSVRTADANNLAHLFPTVEAMANHVASFKSYGPLTPQMQSRLDTLRWVLALMREAGLGEQEESK